MKNKKEKDKIIEDFILCLKEWESPEINELTIINTMNGGGSNVDGSSSGTTLT